MSLKRKKAKELHKKGWSNRKIAKYLLASKGSVGKWVQMDESEISTDNRGWKEGISRIYTLRAKQQIITIRKDLEKENSYFIGSNVVKKNYDAQTGRSVSISFVGRVLKEVGLVKSSGKKEKGRSKVPSALSYHL
jgi:predicted transcriptional regulator